MGDGLPVTRSWAGSSRSGPRDSVQCKDSGMLGSGGHTLVYGESCVDSRGHGVKAREVR